MKEELHTVEGEKGFYKLNKIKVMYEVEEYSTFCTFKNLANNKTEVKFINKGE